MDVSYAKAPAFVGMMAVGAGMTEVAWCVVSMFGLGFWE